MTEKERKIFEMQAPSTRTALSQSLSERELHRLKPIPKEAQCVKEDGSVDLNVRKFNAEESEFYNTEYGASNIYGRARKVGEWRETLFEEKDKTAHVIPTEEQREVAISSWMGSRTVKAISERFKDLMGQLFKPQHAEIMAEAMKKSKEDLHK